MKRSSSPSSPPFAPRLELTPERSRTGIAAVVACLTLALLTILLVPMAWPLRAALIVLLLPAALLAVATPRWREIRYDGGDWRLRDARGVWHAARLLPETLRHPWLVVLQLRLDDDRRAVVPLFYDSLSADDHCALRRVLLRSVSQRAR